MTVRFIILGMGRTGSNLLQSLLASHGDVVCFGELFNATVADRILWQIDRPTVPEDVALRDTDPVRFLEQRVFGGAPGRPSAVGFKLFYYHAREGAWSPIWPHLKGMQDLAVLHLRRQNLLHRIVSEELANRSGRWAITKESEAHGEVRVELPVQMCRNSFERFRGWEREGDAFFADHRVLQLTYEELAADTPVVAAAVQRFLGLPVVALQTQMKKQTRRPMSDVIENFEELRDAFAGTEWSGFFEEEPR